MSSSLRQGSVTPDNSGASRGSFRQARPIPIADQPEMPPGLAGCTPAPSANPLQPVGWKPSASRPGSITTAAGHAPICGVFPNPRRVPEVSELGPGDDLVDEIK